ncbi:MAG: HAMP domain-containing sensor histidine kinase [Methanolobus sp.]
MYANPLYYATSKEMTVSHPVFQKISSRDFIILNSNGKSLEDTSFEKDNHKGTCILFKLKNFGFLKLFWVRKLEDPEYTANQLVNVISRFAFSLEASLLHKRALWEMEEKNKEAEARLYAEASNKAKSEFLANMSHELRTPLNSIIGFSELLTEQNMGALNEKQARYSNNITESGKHLLNIINDILDLSKIEAGEMELHYENVSVKEITDEVIVSLGPLALKNKLILDDSGVEDIVIRVDRGKVKQILYNLIGNAIKFTPAEGTVTVSSIDKGETISIMVQDTGIGISKEDKNKLFEPFKQLDSSLSKNYTGTGLGLSLVNKLVEMHNGKISLESEVEKGSIFTVMLPHKPSR